MPHEIGRDLIPELATRVYSSQLDSFREAVSNALDENSRQVALTLSPQKIVIEDWGNGIADYDEFRKFGKASKKARAGEVIGEKGLGKLSLLNLGSSVCFETNNGRQGIRFSMTMAGFTAPRYSKPAAFIRHQGTRIAITGVKSNAGESEVAPYLKRVFGLRLATGTRISVNSHQLSPKTGLDPDESPLFMLARAGADVSGNLKPDREGKGLVDVYVDHVFVSCIEADTRRAFGGWVNCNALTPETSRNNVVQDGAFRGFLAGLRRYVSRFPLREQANDDQRLRVGRELNTLLKKYIEDMKLNVKRAHGFGGASPAGQEPKAKRRVTAQSPANGLASVGSRLERGSGMSAGPVRWEYADLGNERGPMHFVPPNIVYCNTSSDLFKFALAKRRSLGPTWVRLLPFLSRIAAEINTHSEPLSHTDFNLKVDDAMRYFLRQKGALG